MKKPLEKILFYAGFSDPEAEKKKAEFYAKLKQIEASAVEVHGQWESFYHRTTFKLADGAVWLYFEDTEAGVPSSLERIA